jgi:hypothetical protein
MKNEPKLSGKKERGESNTTWRMRTIFLLSLSLALSQLHSFVGSAINERCMSGRERGREAEVVAMKRVIER